MQKKDLNQYAFMFGIPFILILLLGLVFFGISYQAKVTKYLFNVRIKNTLASKELYQGVLQLKIDENNLIKQMNNYNLESFDRVSRRIKQGLDVYSRRIEESLNNKQLSEEERVIFENVLKKTQSYRNTILTALRFSNNKMLFKMNMNSQVPAKLKALRESIEELKDYETIKMNQDYSKAMSNNTRMLVFIVIMSFVSISICAFIFLLYQKLKKNELLEVEMKHAENIQMGLLPDLQKYKSDYFNIAGLMETADQVGGDYYDVIQDGDKEWLIIGDVSGHGLKAGLVMMQSQVAIHTAIETAIKLDMGILPNQVLAIANKVFYENCSKLSMSGVYMTMTVMMHQKGTVIHAGAHEKIYIYRAKDQKIESISTEGFWLGILADLKDNPGNKNSFFNISKGDKIFLYTDGLIEAWNIEAEQKVKKLSVEERVKLGSRQSDTKIIEETLAEVGDKSPSIIKEKIIEKLAAFRIDDDISIFVIEKK